MQTSEEGKQQDLETAPTVLIGADVDVVEEQPDAPLESGIQIGPGAEQLKEELQEDVGLELGDLVIFHSTRADIETVEGLIYYIDPTRISILETGKSRKLVIFDMEPDENGVPAFLEEYQLTEIELKEKRMLPSFVAQRGMARDMKVETFTAEGEPLTTYTIQTVDEEKDTAVFVDDAGEVINLDFAFKGIPKDKSVAPFDVLRVIEPPKQEPSIPNEAPVGETEEFLDFEFLDDMEAPDVDELSGIVQAIQKPVWERIYQDDDQINDMLRELTAELDPAAQRSSKYMRRVTRLVWNMLSLRNDVTRYSGDRPIGRKPAAYSTLVELLEKTEFPLAKKILAVSKAIYIDHSHRYYLPLTDPAYSDDPLTIADPQIKLQYLHTVIDTGERYLETQLQDERREVREPGTENRKSIPRWITIWQGYFNKYFITILPIREDGDLKDIKFDTDFFRMEIPIMEGDIKPSMLSGFPILLADSNTKVDESYLKEIPFSYSRALGPRYGRYGEGGLTHKIEDADSAEIKGYLLFPLRFIRDLGYIRSGILVMDVANGMAVPKTMKMILQKAEEIVDIPEADKIISVSFDGSTLGNVEIADWLKGQPLYGGGIGDLMPTLRSFGLLQAEFNLQQKLVLESKIAIYRSAVKKLLKESRDKIKQQRETRKPIQTFPLLPKESAYELFSAIYDKGTEEPILKELLEDFANRHYNYRYDDVSRFAYLYLYYPDLLINTLAQNPEVAKERLRAERDIYIQEVFNTILAEKKILDRGQPAQPNPCEHVKDLNKIRKIQDVTQRMLAFNKFVSAYKLKKEKHWLWCNNGEPPHHLICEHEYLLLQEFLRPKEKEVIHKEIILTFSGGKFNGQYICKQCGQAISDFEYDTNVQFSDDGTPMEGNAVLDTEEDDLEAQFIEAITNEDGEDQMNASAKPPSVDEIKIKNIIGELAALVGIFPDAKAYTTMITRVLNALSLVPDRGKYAQSQAKIKKTGRPQTDYDVFIARIYVSLCAAALLIDIQTHIPEYIIRYTLPNCADPQFTGYPKDPDARKPDTGMEYMACAISSIKAEREPWDLTGFQTISDSERIKFIMQYLKTFTEQLAETSDVQQSIIDKKTYLLETFGYETALGRPKDLIPYGFTPAPFIVTKELSAEAESPVIAESASDSEKVRAYIKQAHIYALKYGKYSATSKITETSCCYNPITQPSEFWNAKENLPSLPRPEPPKGTAGSLLYVHMTPRPLERLFGKADASIMYRLFLRVCYKGPRLGEQHEPGYDNICPWCEFKFPEDPRLPPPTPRYAKSASKQEKYDEEYQSELQQKQAAELNALREKGIDDITTENFENLLNNVNQKGIIPQTPRPDVPTPLENMRGTLSFVPTPFEDFEEIIRNTLVALESLTNDAQRKDVIGAFNELSIKTVDLENTIKARLGEPVFVNYTALLKLPPQELGENLRSYFLIPFQRLIATLETGTARKFKPIIKASTTTEFSAEVYADLTQAYARHTSYLNDIIKDIPKTDLFIRVKLKEVVERLSVVIPFFVKILRPTMIRGGAIASQFLQRCIIAGIFSEFINPNHVPQGAVGVTAPRSTLTSSVKIPAKILQACLLKYKDEALNFSQEQIREMIQDRIEKEKNKIIRDKSDLTPEERKLDNLLQRYGMGKWSVGGTKKIWRFDPNQYVSEAEDMAAAGITRFGPQTDVYEAGGYDNEQTTEDNA